VAQRFSAAKSDVAQIAERGQISIFS